MLATAPLASGDRWLFESVLDRIIFVGMMSKIDTNPGEHNSDDQCIHHAKEISNTRQVFDLDPGPSLVLARDRLGTRTRPPESRPHGRWDNISEKRSMRVRTVETSKLLRLT